MDDESAPLPHALNFGDVDGFGRFGILQETEEGVICHQCGGAYAHLGLHSAKAHDLRSVNYRIKHGLRRSTGLVAEATRAKIMANATRNYAGNVPLAASRDLTKPTPRA